MTSTVRPSGVTPGLWQAKRLSTRLAISSSLSTWPYTMAAERAKVRAKTACTSSRTSPPFSMAVCTMFLINSTGLRPSMPAGTPLMA